MSLYTYIYCLCTGARASTQVVLSSRQSNAVSLVRKYIRIVPSGHTKFEISPPRGLLRRFVKRMLTTSANYNTSHVHPFAPQPLSTYRVASKLHAQKGLRAPLTGLVGAVVSAYM